MSLRCHKCGSTWLSKDTEYFASHIRVCDGVRQSGDRRKNKVLRFYGFIDPDRQVPEMMRLLKFHYEKNLVGAERPEAYATTKHLLAEIDAELRKQG